MRSSRDCFERALRQRVCFERARLQTRHPSSRDERALAPEVPDLVQYQLLPMNTDTPLGVRTISYEPDFPECNRRGANSLPHRECDDPKTLSARPPYLSQALS